MKYSTIQVTPRMRRRLARYKLPGMSYESVIEFLTDAIPPEAFREKHERARAMALAGVTAALSPAEAATRDGREIEKARLGRMDPGARMEEAYRLFELMRSPG